MHKILVAVLAGAGAVSSAVALDSPREIELFKVTFVEGCVNKATARLGNAANADAVLRACTCAADYLARVVTHDELIAADNGTPPPSLTFKGVEASRYCLPLKQPVIPAQGFQLSCTRLSATQSDTINGTTETKRFDFKYTVTVTFDLVAKTLSFETIVVANITAVTDTEIIAGHTVSAGGVAYINQWRLNRVTGEMTWDVELTGSAQRGLRHSNFKCEQVKPP
jgi:hypothetical protein